MAFIYCVTQIHIDFDAPKLLEAERGRTGNRRPLIVKDAGVHITGLQ
mgnify:CR=1 FL=1